MGNTILVAQARGVVMLVLAQYKLSFVEFTPAQIKQALTGHGNADKYAVQEAVARNCIWRKSPNPMMLLTPLQLLWLPGFSGRNQENSGYGQWPIFQPKV